MVDLPILVEMLGEAPGIGGRDAMDQQVGDALGHAEQALVAGRLEGRHQGFGQVHVGVLAPVGAERLPRPRELLRDRAVRRLPEAVEQQSRDRLEQRVGVGVADLLGARRAAWVSHAW